MWLYLLVFAVGVVTGILIGRANPDKADDVYTGSKKAEGLFMRFFSWLKGKLGG